MCQFYDFDIEKTHRDVIAACLRSLIKHGDAQRRDAFHTVAYASLKAKKMRCMKFPDYILYPGKGVVHIRARQVVVGKLCPQCDAPLKHESLRMLQVAKEGLEKDLVVWGCILCGRVLARWEDNREKSTGVPADRSLLRPGSGGNGLVPGRRMD